MTKIEVDQNIPLSEAEPVLINNKEVDKSVQIIRFKDDNLFYFYWGTMKEDDIVAFLLEAVGRLIKKLQEEYKIQIIKKTDG